VFLQWVPSGMNAVFGLLVAALGVNGDGVMVWCCCDILVVASGSSWLMYIAMMACLGDCCDLLCGGDS